MNTKKHLIVFIALICFGLTFSQNTSLNFFQPSDSLNHQRLNAVIIGQSAIYASSLFALNQLWYADFDRSKFHTKDDWGQWKQVDKVGHFYSTYQLSRLNSNLFKWTGLTDKKSNLYGTLLGLTYLSTIEVFDGFSKEWGFSWTDMAANTVGAGLYIGQELLWQEQRLLIKYSFHSTKYPNERPDILGNGFQEEFLKDYNGQTYWLSANLHSFTKWNNFPKWLNLAIGYGAEGMITGSYDNQESIDFPQDRYRQFYLSLDVDFSKIKTNSHFLRTVFDVLNTLKVPFTTVEFNGKNEFSVHPIYF